MSFSVNADLLAHARAALWQREGLFWIVGGAGSGKTTVCEILAARFEMLVYDMDAHVYGSFHARFTSERHPVNTAWTRPADGLAWLLDMSWAEFDAFNRGALPEYVDLLCEDFLAMRPGARLLVDGGICNPSLVAQVIPARRVVCLSRPGRSSKQVWTETAERASMKDELLQLANPRLRGARSSSSMRGSPTPSCGSARQAASRCARTARPNPRRRLLPGLPGHSDSCGSDPRREDPPAIGAPVADARRPGDPAYAPTSARATVQTRTCLHPPP